MLLTTVVLLMYLSFKIGDSAAKDLEEQVIVLRIEE